MSGFLDPQALPLNPYPLDGIYGQAYATCLLLEKRTSDPDSAIGFGTGEARDTTDHPVLEHELTVQTCARILGYGEASDATDRPVLKHELTPQICARILGYGLSMSPTEHGRSALAACILDCGGNLDDVIEVAHLYLYGFIRPFYSMERSPIFFDRRSLLRDRRELAQIAVESRSRPIGPQNLRDLVLFRQDYQCKLTGCVEHTSLDQTESRDPATKTGHTVLLKILVYPLREDTLRAASNIRSKYEWASTTKGVLEHFGGASLDPILGDQGQDVPANALAALTEVQAFFNRMYMWLEPAVESGAVIPNAYTVHDIHGGLGMRAIGGGILPRTSFDSRNIEGNDVHISIPPPHPHLIALHATAVQVAQLSGVREHLEEVYCEKDVFRPRFRTVGGEGAMYVLMRELSAARNCERKEVGYDEDVEKLELCTIIYQERWGILRGR